MALLAGLPPMAPAADDDAGASSCAESEATRIWTSPLRPQAGEPLRVMAVSTEGALGEIDVIDPEGRRQALAAVARGGPPWSLSASLADAPAGGWRLEAKRGETTLACRRIRVGEGAGASGSVAAHSLEPDWNPATEAFYSAWIEQLFDAPPEASLDFPSLEPVLRDAGRNFLHDHLGRAEDRGLPATPDCADLPYYLRAYFAWKIGLPVGYRACSRGSAHAPPRCGGAVTRTEFVRGNAAPPAFRGLIHDLQDAVHSGSARTGLADEATDFYPLPLNRESLRPGVVYADPYGHVLVLVKWIAQTASRPGLLLAVDAQPDNSVSRKRFWEGTFLFADEVASAGPGFKAFRPQRLGPGGRWRLAGNDELADAPGFSPFSLQQAELAPEDFYAALGKLINPVGLEPRQAYEATLDSLVEQLETRVISVENGEAYYRKHPGTVIAMPEGAAIFETQGPWEDFSTPSRDLRLIIAMNTLTGLAQRIVSHPELFLLNGVTPQQAKADLEQYHRRRIAERRFQYVRSDGSRWELSVGDVLARKPAFEMAYNPNDCAEARWGAAEGSAEYAGCRRHAPAEQRARMLRQRAWFHEARRPSR